MKKTKILEQFHQIASFPSAQKEAYLKAGKKVVLMAPIYTPEEIIHSMGLVPMAVWGADVEIKKAKTYFPAFICSIVQSIVELGMNGTYDGASAIVIPSLCDSLKVIGENWKYAVPSIPFIPMTYPQNRKPGYAVDFIKAGYNRVIADLEKATGAVFEDEKLKRSIEVYNQHNAAMRKLQTVLAVHPEITALQRNDIYKSAGFMLKEDHTKLVNELIDALEESSSVVHKIKIMTTGILTDSPSLLSIIEENGFQIVVDDVASESRQYRTDAPIAETGLDSLALKFSAMDNCSVLYDVEKKRVDMIVKQAKQYDFKRCSRGADQILRPRRV